MISNHIFQCVSLMRGLRLTKGFTTQGILRSFYNPPGSVPDRCSVVQGKKGGVTTRIFRTLSLFTIHLGKLLFIIYHSSITTHHFTIHHFRSQIENLRSVQKVYYSHNTIHSRKGNTIHAYHLFHRKQGLRVFIFA